VESVFGEGREGVAAVAERFDVGDRLFGQTPGAVPCVLNPQNADEGGLALARVLADRLADGFRIALDIEQVVDDLERPRSARRSSCAGGV